MDWAYSDNRSAATGERFGNRARAEAFRTTFRCRRGTIRMNIPLRMCIEQPTEWRAATNRAAATADGLLTEARLSPTAQFGRQ